MSDSRRNMFARNRMHSRAYPWLGRGIALYLQRRAKPKIPLSEEDAKPEEAATCWRRMPKTITSLEELHLRKKISRKVDKMTLTSKTPSTAAYVRPSMVNATSFMETTMIFDSAGIARNSCVPTASGLKSAAPVTSKCAVDA